MCARDARTAFFAGKAGADPCLALLTDRARFFIVGLVLEVINVLACLGIICKIARRRRGGGGAAARASTDMAKLIDDLLLLLMGYNLLYELVFGVLVNVAYLLPADSPLGSKALGLFVYGVPFSWPPFFLHTYIASVCYSWLVLGHSIPRIKRRFRPAMCWIFVAFLVQAFFEVRTPPSCRAGPG